MRVIALDPAIRSQNFGMCVLDGTSISFPQLDPASVNALESFHAVWKLAKADSKAQAAANAIASFVVQMGPNILVLDGPQGFARAGRNMRRAEAILRTNGSTGSGYSVPKNGFSWPGIVQLSVRLFERFRAAGYARLTKPSINSRSKSAVEVLPDASWHCFGRDQQNYANLKGLKFNVSWPAGTPSEHELDAAVSILTVLAALRGTAVYLGSRFHLDSAGKPREGYIVIPNPGVYAG